MARWSDAGERLPAGADRPQALQADRKIMNDPVQTAALPGSGVSTGMRTARDGTIVEIACL